MPVFSIYFAMLTYRNHFYFASWPTENTCRITGIKITLFREAKMFHYKTVQAMSCCRVQRASFACLAHLSFPQHPITHLQLRKAAGDGSCFCVQGKPRVSTGLGHTDCRPEVPEGTKSSLGPKGSSHSPKGKHFSCTRKNGPNKQKRKYIFQLQKNWLLLCRKHWVSLISSFPTHFYNIIFSCCKTGEPSK